MKLPHFSKANLTSRKYILIRTKLALMASLKSQGFTIFLVHITIVMNGFPYHICHLPNFLKYAVKRVLKTISRFKELMHDAIQALAYYF